MTDDEWARGVNALEVRVADEAAKGEQMWPPTYAEFVGICKPPTKAEGEKRGSYNDFFARDENGLAIQLPEPIEYRTKRKKAGESSLNKLMGMFDE